jgi:transglutaminase-like putative cysteine protease
MSSHRTHLLPTHLTLALAGVCLAIAEILYLPELLLGLLPYLGLVALSWRRGGQGTLPVWAANLLGLAIAAGAGLWVQVRLGNRADTWVRDVPLPAIVIPYLGPVLMALLLVRLFRPRTPSDFWVLQGLGLLQVALGCVLASSSLFAISLFAYLVAAICALAAHERQSLAIRNEGATDGRKAGRERRWLAFGLRWAPVVALLALPLFLLTPRLEESDWDPLSRFGMKPNRESARMGFSEEINLKRTGRLEPDDSPAFTVRVTDVSGKPIRGLRSDTRWRGMVLDRYEDGIWRSESEMAWPRLARKAPPEAIEPKPGDLILKFRVPRRVGGLFLADPLLLGSRQGELPVVEDPFSGPRKVLFFEAGGTAVSLGDLAHGEYRYAQAMARNQDRDRYPVVRVNETYLRKLILYRAPGVAPWSLERARRLAATSLNSPPGLREVLQRPPEPGSYLPPVYWEPLARMFTDYLARSGEFTYSLESRHESVTLEPVLDFLTNVKQGHCEQYAAALALLLRTRGIPARIVKGYRGAEFEGDGVYEVRNRDAHAWVEALAVSKEGTGYDWIVLDPTPVAEAPPPSTLGLWQQSGQALWRGLILGYTADEQGSLWEQLTSDRLMVLASWAGVAIVFVIAVWLVRRYWREKGRSGKAETESLYARLRRVLERSARLQPRPDETPGELARRAEEILASRAATASVADVPGRVVALYYPMRYGGRVPEEAALRQAERSLDALASAIRGDRSS